MSTQQHLARIGAVAAMSGAVTLFVATLLHPMSADPNDPPAAFAEYAADRLWVASHLGQFLGVAALGVALVALGRRWKPVHRHRGTGSAYSERLRSLSRRHRCCQMTA